MNNKFDNPQHWRERAEETRQIARLVSDHQAKETILQMADEYEQLARDAEHRPRQGKSSN